MNRHFFVRSLLCKISWHRKCPPWLQMLKFAPGESSSIRARPVTPGFFVSSVTKSGPAEPQSQPLVSTLNAPTGAITANAAIVPAGTGGAINLFATDSTDMAIDINGYFAAPVTGGLSLYNLTPCRIEDTRQPAGAPAFTGTVTETATGVACGVPPEAQSLVLNATVVPSGELGYRRDNAGTAARWRSGR